MQATDGFSTPTPSSARVWSNTLSTATPTSWTKSPARTLVVTASQATISRIKEKTVPVSLSITLISSVSQESYTKGKSTAATVREVIWLGNRSSAFQLARWRTLTHTASGGPQKADVSAVLVAMQSIIAMGDVIVGRPRRLVVWHWAWMVALVRYATLMRVTPSTATMAALKICNSSLNSTL